jgi:hypothetical protein
LCEGFFADVIHDGLHKKVGDVNSIKQFITFTAIGIDQIHASGKVWRFPVIEFCWFIFKEADESYIFDFAGKFV